MRLKFKNVGLRFDTHYKQWYVTPALYAVRIPGFKPDFMPGFQIPGFWHIELTWLKWAFVFTIDRKDEPGLPVYEPQVPELKNQEPTEDRLQKLIEKSAQLLRYLIFIYAAIAVLQALEVILKLSK